MNPTLNLAKRKKLTPKQRVLRKWPGAEYVRHGRREHSIFRPLGAGQVWTGGGRTPAEAWASAARNL